MLVIEILKVEVQVLEREQLAAPGSHEVGHLGSVELGEELGDVLACPFRYVSDNQGAVHVISP